MWWVNTAIGVRIIGSLGVVSGLVNIIQFPDSLFTLYQDKHSVHITWLLSVNEEEFYNMYLDQIETDLTVLKLFCILYAISSGFLIWASYGRKYLFTLPWLVCATIDVALQGYQIVRPYRHNPKTIKRTTEPGWYSLFAVFCFLVTLSITGCVFYAAFKWQKKCNDEENTADPSPTRPC